MKPLNNKNKFIFFLFIVLILFFFMSSDFNSALAQDAATKMKALMKKMQELQKKLIASQSNPEAFEAVQKEMQALAKEFEGLQKAMEEEAKSLPPILNELHARAVKALDMDPMTQSEEINKESDAIMNEVAKIFSGDTDVTSLKDSFAITVRFCEETTVIIEDKGKARSKEGLYDMTFHFKTPIKAVWTAEYLVDIVKGKGHFLGFSLISEDTGQSAKKVQVVSKSGWKQVITKEGVKKGPIDIQKVELGPAIVIGPGGLDYLKKIDLYDPQKWPDNLVKKYMVQVISPLIWFRSSSGDQQIEKITPIANPCMKNMPNKIDISSEELNKHLEKGKFSKTFKGITFDPNCLENTVTINAKFSLMGCKNQPNPGSGAIVRAGDCLDHGGYILTSEKSVFVNGKPVARVGDKVMCFIHGITEIVGDASNNFFAGKKRIARVGDKTKCGATILGGSPDTFDKGKK